ncbi:MAG: AEC family transporter [Eubacteriales bacterium]|nr:AEC family transporter [Eubacteriales bacterium]
MENLLFSFNATLPIFLTMALGMVFRKVGLMDEAFVAKMNKFVFVAALPVLLFQDLSGTDFYEAWDTRFVLFCFFATLAGILLVWGLSFFLKDKSIQGEFIQAGYRSSAAILGIAFIQNIYGDSGMAPLMIIGTVPLYNIMAVVVLSLVKPERGKLSGALLKKTVKGILTNPIILGIAAGLVWSLLKIPQPEILQKTVKNVAVLATPLGLMAMGASFDPSKVSGKLRPAIGASFLKLVGLAALFLPLAVRMGFREEKLVAILVMLGSASTVSCFIMAKNMGHEGVLTSAVVMITTLFSAVTLTVWLFLLRTLGLI